VESSSAQTSDSVDLRRRIDDDGGRLLVAMERIASVAGPDFFATAVELLKMQLDVEFVFIAECTDSEKGMARTLAFWGDAGAAENLDFCAHGGPCEGVLAGDVVHVVEHVCEQFPHNEALNSLAPDSYLGYPLITSSGSVIGHVAAMDVRPMNPSPEDLVILRVLASRAAAELERKQTKEARTSSLIHSSEERFRLAQEAAEIGTWDMDVLTGRGTWSDNYWGLYGLSPDSCTPGYEAWIGLVHPEDREAVDSLIKAALQGEARYDAEFRIVWPDGSVRWLVGKATVFRDGSGNPIRMIGVDYDITDRKEAEVALQGARTELESRVQERTAELSEANRALHAEISAREAQERLFQTVADGTSAVTGIAFLRSLVRHLATALEAQYAFVSERLQDTGQVNVIEMWMGDHFGDEMSLDVSGAPCAQVFAGEDAVFPDGVPTLFPGHPILSALGVESYLGVPLFDSSNAIIGHLAVLGTGTMENPRRGLSVLKVFASRAGAEVERKRFEQHQKEFEAELQQTQKLESLGVLAGGIAHDFNNLLTGVLGNAELALAALPPESPARRELANITRSALRAAELTKQMLAYSGQGKLEVQGLNLSKLVEEIGHLLEVSISKKAVLTYDLAADLPLIEADASQIRQVVMNVLINASEAIEKKSGYVRISTRMIVADRSFLATAYVDDDLPEGDYVTLEVEDTGCGMDEQTQRKIFDPFFTTKFTGRGLGLAAVLGIVRGHGGALKIDSRPQAGSTFTVLFPASERSVEEPLGPLVGEQEWRGSGTVLVVDDEETVRITSQAMLESLGFTVMTAEDGPTALEVYGSRNDEIDAVLLDLTMPHLDGEETFRELRRIRPGVRVILSSGYSEGEISDRFEGTGLGGFIQKPYGMRPLYEKMRQVLGPVRPSDESISGSAPTN
jgi:PAS domain S-box-containing protein